MKSIVVGAGRSGTGWLAAAFRTYGLRYGHEDVFDFQSNSGSAERWGDLDGDSSLAAWHYLDRAPPDTRIVRLYRHPRDIAYSWMGKWFFADTCPCHEPNAHRLAPYAEWIARVLPGVYQEQDEIDRCIRYVLDVNDAIGAAIEGFQTAHVRLEDLIINSDLLDETALFIGGNPPRSRSTTLEERNAGTPRVVGLKQRPLGRALGQLARSQGYDW